MEHHVPSNVRPQRHLVTRSQRAALNGHSGAIFWLTGLSGSGKSTIAMASERDLCRTGERVYVLDGDNIRAGLNRDLRFSASDRSENIRRVADVAALFADSGAIVLTALISPTAADRAAARAAANAPFYEIYLSAGLPVCEARDPKGLYLRARANTIPNFTGISAPYEPPQQADLEIDTSTDSVARCVAKLVSFVRRVTALTPTSADATLIAT